MTRRRGSARALTGAVLLMLLVGACSSPGSGEPPGSSDSRPERSGEPPGAEAIATPGSAPPAPPALPSSPNEPTGDPACRFDGATFRQESPPGPAMRYLTAVSVASDGCTDRVTFRFEAAASTLTPGFSVEYREGPFLDSSDRSTEVTGDAFLTVRLRPARVARIDASGVVDTYEGPRIVTPDPVTVGVQQVGLYGAFEGNLRFVIGLDRVRPFQLTPGTDAFVVEIGEPRGPDTPG